MYTIEEIEDAYISALEAMKATHGVLDIKTYENELDSEEEIKKTVMRFPAIYVVYGGSKYQEHGMRKIETMRHTFFVCDKNLRSNSEARRGGRKNPGSYALLNGIRDLLYGQQLSLKILPVSLIQEDAVWFGKGIAVYAAEYETAQALLYTGD